MNLIKKSYSLSILYLLLFNILISCSETTFLVNSAKRIGSWGDDPIYKVGNPYKINGKWYYPAIDYDYEEIGIASWYGPGFHGKKTANGEIFNQNKISAAHRTLPMPSIVKVTNLDNGLVLQRVRINDRGPFAGNRIIDLSKKAAEELGFVNSGTARVKVEILEDESRKHAIENSDKKVTKVESAKVQKIKKVNIKDSSVSSNLINNWEEIEVKKTNKEVLSVNPIFKNKPLAIQVGAFTDHRNAKTLTEKLSEFKAYIERIFVNNQYLYRVRIGPINDIGVAENIKDKLFKLGYTTSHLIVN
jgi:rare lipoprotein A